MSLLRKFANGPRVALAVPLVISLFLVTYCVYVSGLSTFSFRTGARVAGWYGDRNRMRNLRKPSGTVVSGLVFYGRRDRASCLRCYLDVSTLLVVVAYLAWRKRSRRLWSSLLRRESLLIISCVAEFGGQRRVAGRSCLADQHGRQRRPRVPGRNHRQQPEAIQEAECPRRDAVDLYAVQSMGAPGAWKVLRQD